jgi:hypothetical protein
MDQGEQIVTPCPHCERPIAWATYTRGGIEALEVADQGCACTLSRDQWADLAEQAEVQQAEREG